MKSVFRETVTFNTFCVVVVLKVFHAESSEVQEENCCERHLLLLKVKKGSYNCRGWLGYLKSLDIFRQ